jgi:hypothetical protein
MVKTQLWTIEWTPEFSNIWWHPTKIYGPKVFLLTKIKPEYSDILYNPTHFPGPLADCSTVYSLWNIPFNRYVFTMIISIYSPVDNLYSIYMDKSKIWKLAFVYIMLPGLIHTMNKCHYIVSFGFYFSIQSQTYDAFTSK